MTHLYRAHLAAEQMAAENIVRFTRESPEVKLLVFFPDDVMINPPPVPDYVSPTTAAVAQITAKMRKSPKSLLLYFSIRNT